MIVLPSVRDNCIDDDHTTTKHPRVCAAAINTGLDIRRQRQVLLREQARHDAFLNKHTRTRADAGGGGGGVRGRSCLPHAAGAAGAVQIVDGVQREVEVDDVLGGNLRTRAQRLPATRTSTKVVSRPRAAMSVHTSTGRVPEMNSLKSALRVCNWTHTDTHAHSSSRSRSRNENTFGGGGGGGGGALTWSGMSPWQQAVAKPCPRRKCSTARQLGTVLQNIMIRRESTAAAASAPKSPSPSSSSCESTLSAAWTRGCLRCCSSDGDDDCACMQHLMANDRLAMAWACV
jgi:hypothetical protein